MSNEIIEKYSKLNDDGKFFVDCAINAAVSNPEYQGNLSDEEKNEIKCKREEREKKKQDEDAKRNEFFDNLKAESEYFTRQDYINSLNELYSIMSIEALRYFYLFTYARYYM